MRFFKCKDTRGRVCYINLEQVSMIIVSNDGTFTCISFFNGNTFELPREEMRKVINAIEKISSYA